MTTKEYMESNGPVFRLITPVLITILGTISILYLKTISIKFDRIDSKFDTVLESYHTLDKRVDILEYKFFNQNNHKGESNGL